ncbi:MAG: diheme cytochrome c-553 [Planctomycetes bacterium]|nr:diheme cytochrome c-553 [Planctomycetota bacterium]
MFKLVFTFTLACAGLIAVSSLARSAVDERAKVDAKTIARGEYLATTMHCNDCHTPMKFGPNGPEPDFARRLSGHPSTLVMPPAPTLPEGPWAFVGSGSMTAWHGAWGTSFTANLTPDDETGIGRWSEKDFVDTMRSGRHLGRGREILPPMPWQNVGAATDEDLHALFTYLKSLPPISNRVPEPLPPAAH